MRAEPRIITRETLGSIGEIDLATDGGVLLVDKPAGISVRIDSVEPLDQAASRLQHALRIFLRGADPLESIQRHLAPGGEGDVSLIVLGQPGRGEVEVKLPGRWRVSPQLAGALRAVPGVVQVELA